MDVDEVLARHSLQTFQHPVRSDVMQSLWQELDIDGVRRAGYSRADFVIEDLAAD
jgi:hypothetical protein